MDKTEEILQYTKDMERSFQDGVKQEHKKVERFKEIMIKRFGTMQHKKEFIQKLYEKIFGGKE